MRPSISIVALSLALCSAPAIAQSRYDRAAAPTASQFADQFDARIAKLKADLRLTPDQARNWDGLRDALHDMGAARADRLAKSYGERDAYADRGRDMAADRGAPAPAPQSAPATDNRPTVDRDAARNDTTAPADTERRAEVDRAPARDRDMRDARDRDDGAIADMRMQARALQDQADDLKKIADAADPLYATLDTRQRRLLLRFISRDWQTRPSFRG